VTLHQSFAGDSKTPKTRPMQKNAVAGPSAPANPSGVTRSRKSSRISRPTAKKVATQIRKPAVVSGSDSDFDSDQSFPSNILPKSPSNLKKRKISRMSRPSPPRGKELEAKHSSLITHFLQGTKQENRRRRAMEKV
jgi:hypothetical protein